MPYLDKPNIVISRYGNNDPPALVLFLSTVNNSTSCSTLITSTTYLSIAVMTSAVSEVVALHINSTFH